MTERAALIATVAEERRQILVFDHLEAKAKSRAVTTQRTCRQYLTEIRAGKPVLEVNPNHALIEKLSAVDAGNEALRTDAVHLLFDEARIADGELPVDPRAFSGRLIRLLERGIT